MRRRRFVIALPVAAGVVLLATLAVAVGSAGRVPSEQQLPTWVADDSVNALARSGRTIYAGGFFSHMAPRTGPFVVLSATEGRRDPAYPELSGFASLAEDVNSPVLAIVDDGSGGWFLGGSFRYAGGTECPRLAHIRANETLDRAFCAHPNGPVLALARAESTLYVAGQFSTIGGKPRGNLAALDLGTGGVTSWRSDATGKTYSDGHSDLEPNVDALAVAGSTVYVGGFFDHVRGKPRRSIAAIDATSAEVRTWNPGVGKAPERVLTLDASAEAVYIGGSFETVDGKQRLDAAAVDATSGQVASWNPAPNGNVWQLAVSGARVYVAGDFKTIAGAHRNGLAALDAQSGRTASWDPKPQGSVDAIAPAGRTVYVSGGFKRIGGRARHGLAALDANGRATSWKAPDPNFDSCCSTMPALATAGGKIAAGGNFASMGGVARDGLAAISQRTGRPNPWHPRFVTQALAVSGSMLYAGYEGLAAINIHTGRTAWTRRLNPVTTEVVSGSIDALATDGTTVYVGGYFVTIGGKQRRSLAAVDAVTGSITPWHPVLGGSLLGGLGEVRALAVVGRTLYVGGEFDSAGGKQRANLAALDTKTGDVLAWNPGTNAEPSGVNTLVASGRTLYAGGDFTKVDGRPRRGVAAIDIRTGAVRPWNPELGGTVDVEVDAIALSTSTVYIGGVFGSVARRPRRNLAAVRVSSAVPLSWSPRVGELTPDFGVRALALGPSALFVGGGFESVGANEQRYLARFRLR